MSLSEPSVWTVCSCYNLCSFIFPRYKTEHWSIVSVHLSIGQFKNCAIKCKTMYDILRKWTRFHETFTVKLNRYMSMSFLWVETPCWLAVRYYRFWGTYWLHRQPWRLLIDGSSGTTAAWQVSRVQSRLTHSCCHVGLNAWDSDERNRVFGPADRDARRNVSDFTLHWRDARACALLLYVRCSVLWDKLCCVLAVYNDYDGHAFILTDPASPGQQWQPADSDDVMCEANYGCLAYRWQRQLHSFLFGGVGRWVWVMRINQYAFPVESLLRLPRNTFSFIRDSQPF
jgi:hypothetical protein